jgi:hypothetical protein
MVLDAKALTWASQNNLDTAKLKAAKVPIYGKWYFPEILPGVRVINLETGERKVFDRPMVAGEVLWVPEEDLRRAGIGPFAPGAEEKGGPTGQPVESHAPLATHVAAPPEPLLAMTRPPIGVEARGATATTAATERAVEVLELEDLSLGVGIHLPKASIAPFVLGVGFCIVGLGLITHPIILVVGVLWMIAGAIGWIRIGLLELREASAHHEVAHEPHPEPS